MKSLLRNLFTRALGVLSRLILGKYKPRVVMVTGSVGKTSTKDALAVVLASRFYSRASEKSFNSELGVPLTVFGAQNPWASPVAWARVVLRAWALVLLPSHYPKLLVLEVGADHPGDLRRILRVATPDVVVVTRLPEIPVHVEAYAAPESVREEEFLPAYALASRSPLILSSDDEYALALSVPLNAAVTTFGEAADATFRMTQIRAWEEEGEVRGMEAVLTHEEKEYPLRVSGALGRTQLLASLAAAAAASTLGMSVEESLTALERYVPPAGRARLLLGVDEMLLVDDTYNASPAAVEEGLRALTLISGRRRVAILGDMLELGRYSNSEHERIGALAAHQVNVLITVGTRSRVSAQAAIAAGLSDSQVHSFDTSTEAAGEMRKLLELGDVVLIKGSQSMRMERVVEVLLKNADDKKYLVRQDAEWKKR